MTYLYFLFFAQGLFQARQGFAFLCIYLIFIVFIVFYFLSIDFLLLKKVMIRVFALMYVVQMHA